MALPQHHIAAIFRRTNHRRHAVTQGRERLLKIVGTQCRAVGADHQRILGVSQCDIEGMAHARPQVRPGLAMQAEGKAGLLTGKEVMPDIGATPQLQRRQLRSGDGFQAVHRQRPVPAKRRLITDGTGQPRLHLTRHRRAAKQQNTGLGKLHGISGNTV